jgi:hypothetical protein
MESKSENRQALKRMTKREKESLWKMVDEAAKREADKDRNGIRRRKL